MDDLTQFIWRRATGRGYVWQTLRTTERKRVRLLTFPTPGVGAPADLIEPQNINPALLWQLAETEISEPAIKEFADAFGLLAGETTCWPQKGGKAYFGDPLITWVSAIESARMVVHLWSAVETR